VRTQDALDAGHFFTALAAAGITQDVADDMAHAFWCGGAGVQLGPGFAGTKPRRPHAQ
jgi:hypothetical protein